MQDFKTKTQVRLFLVAFFIFPVVLTAQGCRDRIKTQICQTLLQMYRQTSKNSCQWKSMKINCALTCKHCVPKPICAQPISKYGCCWDNKTEARGYTGEGCPECKDRYVNWCRIRITRFPKESACNRQGKRFCPKSCNVCSAHAAAEAPPECLDSPYGCCWDGTAAQGPEGKGCRVCKDLYNNLCRFWRDYCKPEGLRFVRKRVVENYRLSCPVTCNKCRVGQKMMDPSVYLHFKRAAKQKTS